MLNSNTSADFFAIRSASQKTNRKSQQFLKVEELKNKIIE